MIWRNVNSVLADRACLSLVIKFFKVGSVLLKHIKKQWVRILLSPLIWSFAICIKKVMCEF